MEHINYTISRKSPLAEERRIPATSRLVSHWKSLTRVTAHCPYLETPAESSNSTLCCTVTERLSAAAAASAELTGWASRWQCETAGEREGWTGWRMNDNEVCAGSSRSWCFSLLNSHSLRPSPLLMHMYNVRLWQLVWGSAFYRFGNVRRCTFFFFFFLKTAGIF